MSVFLVRTATRPGYTTYLSSPRPGHTARLMKSSTRFITKKSAFFLIALATGALGMNGPVPKPGLQKRQTYHNWHKESESEEAPTPLVKIGSSEELANCASLPPQADNEHFASPGLRSSPEAAQGGAAAVAADKKEFRFFAHLKRFYKKSSDTKYSENRWLERLCVLDTAGKTLTVYKSRESGWKRNRKGGESTQMSEGDMEGIVLPKNPSKQLSIRAWTKKNQLTPQSVTKDKIFTISEHSNARIIVKGRCTVNTSFGTFDQIWLLSVYDMKNDAETAGKVNNRLHDAGLIDDALFSDVTPGGFMYHNPPPVPKRETTIRRRLTGAEILHRHRLTTPYRDSPVLLRLLKEIREANQQ